MRPALTSTSGVVASRGRPAPAELDALPVQNRAGARRGDLLVLEMTVSQEKRVRRMTHLDAILMLR
jgi:hypothetical protein